MHKTVAGTYRGGVIELGQPLEIPDGSGVEIELRTVSGQAPRSREGIREAMARRSRFLKLIRAYTDKYPEAFKGLKFTREELHERR